MFKLDHRDVTIPIANGHLNASFCEPSKGYALVVFAHGSGSSRLSPRNQFVADQLASAGFGTLLFDLLTEEEDQVHENRFDIPLLSTRLVQAVHWAKAGQVTPECPLAFFGASTGAAAALIAAADLGIEISAVVSRGGRPDLAGEALRRVHCPTLLIVGGLDFEVIELNREAKSQMPVTTLKELAIVPGATHLFEEPGKLERVAELATDWLKLYALVW